jgi:hypothetical protein
MSKQPDITVYANGSKDWRLRGNLHRTDGPAWEWADGSKMWFLNGNEVSWREVFKKASNLEIELRILSFLDNLLT